MTFPEESHLPQLQPIGTDAVALGDRATSHATEEATGAKDTQYRKTGSKLPNMRQSQAC
jgi:hypothetical protein